MSLPFLFSLWLVLLKFLPSFAWTTVQKNLIDWLPVFYYSKSSLYIALSYNVFLNNKKQNDPTHQSKPNMTMSLPHLLFFKGSLLLVRQSSDSSASHIVTLLSFLVLGSSRTPCDLAIPSRLPFPKHIMPFILRLAVFSSAWNSLHKLSAENSLSSVSSSVQQGDNHAYFRGSSWGLNKKMIFSP